MLMHLNEREMIELNKEIVAQYNRDLAAQKIHEYQKAIDKETEAIKEMNSSRSDQI